MQRLQPITVETAVNAPMKHVWDAWTKPEHITKWAFADSTWVAPHAENDLRVGGSFNTRMEAADGSQGFDFTGVYDAVEEHALIEYDMSHGRHVTVTFEETPTGVKVTETFDPETENPPEMQRAGWQSILDNFKNYAESLD